MVLLCRHVALPQAERLVVRILAMQAHLSNWDLTADTLLDIFMSAPSSPARTPTYTASEMTEPYDSHSPASISC
jgi:hypothetical protein